MIRKATRMGTAAAVVLGTFLVPTQAAYASDGCGSGWYKESDGYLTKDSSWSGAGYHNAWIYHSGRVRFCTDNDTFNDDENRRALIGYPSDSYPFESWVDKNGNYTKFCVRQTVKAHMSGIKTRLLEYRRLRFQGLRRGGRFIQRHLRHLDRVRREDGDVQH